MMVSFAQSEQFVWHLVQATKGHGAWQYQSQLWPLAIACYGMLQMSCQSMCTFENVNALLSLKCSKA